MSDRSSTTRRQIACVQAARPSRPPRGTALDQWCLALVDGGLTQATRQRLALIFLNCGATLKSTRRRQARQGEHQLAEPVAANLEIAILVERGARRRQQHDWLGHVAELGISRRHIDRALQRADDDM